VIRHKRQEVRDKTKNCLSAFYTNESVRLVLLRHLKIAPNARLYLFDLAGYGQMPLNVVSNDVFLIAGWSDKIFEVLEAIENGETALQMIEKVNL
jgi:hypothetical protein